MPAPEYMPLGRPSARPRPMSITEAPLRWPATSRTTSRALKGRLTAARAYSKRLGRSSVPTSMSRNGVGTCWLTTRIISSGVTPLAASAATKAPALVPTYTSNWLAVRLTESRSSARSAPISYTPPVKPPPPSTSAVFDRRGRRRRGAPFGAAVGSSLTTLPIPPHGTCGPDVSHRPEGQRMRELGWCAVLRRLPFVAALLSALAFAAPAHALDRPGLARSLARLEARMGPYAAAYVVDLASGQPI